ncbi:hypothetical protein GCM10009817_30800 [Terrabacter lapilli]|uniref:SIR2-like protein n=1 Tax=Terrabacter lapilli TaxID=436231 RepID=A0ABP5DYX5_9MICO
MSNGEIEAQANDELRPADGHSECVFCGQDYDFELPLSLVQAAKQGRLVIFAGAGISTETSRVFPSTFYEEIKSQLPDDSAPEEFPAVMSAYEEIYGRLQLVQQAITRIRYAETFPAVEYAAARFHRELATIYQIREIITTNWDGFFEDVCGAIPIVVDGDYAFYELPDRKVYKIHGSLRNVSTVVATTQDYRQAEESLRKSAVGGTLRHLLATKVVVFVGYSLRDADFRNVYEPLMQGMGKLRPVSYFVGPYDSDEAAALGLRHLKTDGTHFVRSLKAHLVNGGALLPDEVIDRARALRGVVGLAHDLTADMDWRSHPEIVFSLAYQDGLLDSLNRIAARWITGEYTDAQRVQDSYHSYGHLLHTAVHRERFWDAAYIDGYRDGIMVLLLEDGADVKHLPIYEFFNDPFFHGPAEPSSKPDGDEDAESNPLEPEGDVDGEGEEDAEEQVLPRLLSQDELLELLDGVFQEIPALEGEARKIAEGMSEGIIPQHTPFLNGVLDPE